MEEQIGVNESEPAEQTEVASEPEVNKEGKEGVEHRQPRRCNQTR